MSCGCARVGPPRLDVEHAKIDVIDGGALSTRRTIAPTVKREGRTMGFKRWMGICLGLFVTVAPAVSSAAASCETNCDKHCERCPDPCELFGGSCKTCFVERKFCVPACLVEKAADCARRGIGGDRSLEGECEGVSR